MWKMKIWRGVVREISEGDITSGIWRAVVTSSLLVSLPPSHLPLNVVVLVVVVVLVLLLIVILLFWLSLLLKSFLFGDHEASNTKRQVQKQFRTQTPCDTSCDQETPWSGSIPNTQSALQRRRLGPSPLQGDSRCSCPYSAPSPGLTLVHCFILLADQNIH